MDSLNPYVLQLDEKMDTKVDLVGGKAAKLSQLKNAGYCIPEGFCLTTTAYHDFAENNSLKEKIAFELDRKNFEDMRWEEIWDAALRIRSSFIKAELSDQICSSILPKLKKLDKNKELVIRSSSPKEDSSSVSFAGLHESIVGVKGEKAIVNAIKQVWASLWSDAALLYQHELGLNPMNSKMAIVIQELVEKDVSGVGFSQDPDHPKQEQSIIEAVPGLCKNLVDGTVDPDKWILDRQSGKIINYLEGDRDSQEDLLNMTDVKNIYKVVVDLENLFDWPADIEWTGLENEFTLLQARPITTSESQTEDEKSYYLTLRPGEHKLKELAQEVDQKLIPELKKLGRQMAEEDITKLNDKQLSEKILNRRDSYKKWKNIYKESFIPFAHGVRHFASYYNDVVQPSDPYEFVGLLKGQEMIASRRNRKMAELANILKNNYDLARYISNIVTTDIDWSEAKEEIELRQQETGFLPKFENLMQNYMDVSYEQDRLKHHPTLILQNILEMIDSNHQKYQNTSNNDLDMEELEQKYYNSIEEDEKGKAKEILEIGRLSWRLRDDDNLLLGRVESQLLKSIEEGASRLQKANRLENDYQANIDTAEIIAEALQSSDKKVILPESKEPNTREQGSKEKNVKPRQIVGQPAAKGITSGTAKIVTKTEDLGDFKQGEILVCDAIQPNMTHLVPLASAIVERRGGMLIHGAIIARELGIPCVNGVPKATQKIENGELITVDGDRGVVTIGAPEFDLELDI